MINVTTVYPADPLGIIPGGIDTIIRDIISCAPTDFKYSLLGATTDPVARPVRQWTRCHLGDIEFDFFPVYAIKNPGVRPRFPATIRHLLPLLLQRPRHQIDILESHRIEPMLAYLNHPAPMFVFNHQNSANLISGGSDIRWKYAPKLLARLEDWLVPKFRGVYCVNEQTVKEYRQRYPYQAANIQFMPTWTNPDLFFPASAALRKSLKHSIRQKYNIDRSARLIIFVGRIDHSKNPSRLIRAISTLVRNGEDIHLILVGDGILYQETRELVARLDLLKHVTFAGLLPNHKVANYIRGCDMLVLSSNYEGMPVCALEALACGIPVASTPVGAISKIVENGICGNIATGFEIEDLAAAISECLARLDQYQGKPCTDAAKPYTPGQVLDPIFESYRRALI